MARLPILSFLLALSAGALSAQVPISRANVEIDAAGVFPIDGSEAETYSTGPGLRAGGAFRLHRNLVAEAGWTSAWMATYYGCSSVGCSYSRLENPGGRENWAFNRAENWLVVGRNEPQAACQNHLV